MKGLCIKCRDVVEMEYPRNVKMKDGKRWIRGECPHCSTSVWKRMEDTEASNLVYAFHLN